MALAIRMVLYFIGSFVAGFGFASMDQGAGTLTIDIDALASVLGGLVTFGGTFIASRVAKARGGAT